MKKVAFRAWFRLIHKRIQIHHLGRLVSYSILIGVVAGIGSLLFHYLLSFLNDTFLHGICQYSPPVPGGEGVSEAPLVPRRWLFLLIPTLGGLVSGLLVYKIAPEAEGHGTDAVIEAFHQRRGIIRARVPIVKMLASAVTIGTGGSAGREGPIAQIGGGFGSFLSRKLRLSERERRILVLSGVGAGIGSIFRAPLGGALFAGEVLYREPEFEFEAIIPTFISSIVGYSVYCSLLGGKWGAIFTDTHFTFTNPTQLLLYAVLAVVLAGFGMGYSKIFYLMRDNVFRKIPVHNVFKPAIGGLMLGILAFFIPEVLGMGYGYVQEAIRGNVTIQFMLILAVAKIIATSFTISSGGSGGVFAPSLVIGGMLGGAFGYICNHFFPGIVPADQASAFVLIGMAGFFSGVAKVPIASMIMVSEMTVGYALLVPLMLVVAVAYLVTPRHFSIYEKQVDARVDSPAHQGDFIVDILEMLPVRAAFKRSQKVITVPDTMLLDDLLQVITQTTLSSFPVVNKNNELSGIVSLDDIRGILLEGSLGNLVIARDIAVSGIEPIFLEENLNTALKKFISSNSDELPIVSQEKPAEVIGILNRRDLIGAYNEAIREHLEKKKQPR